MNSIVNIETEFSSWKVMQLGFLFISDLSVSETLGMDVVLFNNVSNILK